MKYLNETIKNILNEKLKISTRAGKTSIQQTQRNLIKIQLENALIADLNENLENVIIGRTAEGLIIAIDHEQNEIPIEINLKIKTLEYDTYEEIEMYEAEQHEKLMEKAEKEKAKKEKIKADTLERERKRLEKEKEKGLK